MREDRVGWLDGLFIGASNATLVIDPSTTRRIPKTARVLVSHAHGDHTGGFSYKGPQNSIPLTRDINSVLPDPRGGGLRSPRVYNTLPVHRILGQEPHARTTLSAGPHSVMPP